MKASSPVSWEVRAYIGLIVFSLCGTLASRALKLDPGLIGPVSSVLTIAIGVVVAFGTEVDARLWKVGIGVGLFGAATEVLGLATGFPFGRYEYTDQWLPVIWLNGLGFFPLLLPLAWLMITAAAARVIPNPVLAGLLAASIDLVMEPVAVHTLRYWAWTDGGPLPGNVPVANFFAWWVISGLGAFALQRAGLPADRRGWVVLVGHLGLMVGLLLLDLAFRL
ncbi:COG2324 Predicted membrane protein [Fimbriimonadaceae bacterium]